MMDKRFQVFISSTHEDLIVEREIASLAILRSQNIPSGMELSSGANERTLDIIYRWIDDSDIFLLLLGGRYGSVDRTSGLSYTELEYNYAKLHGKPVIALWLTDEYIDSKIMRGTIAVKVAYERTYIAKMSRFRQKVTQDSFCIPVSSHAELEAKIFAALDSVRLNHALGGWVRASNMLELMLDLYAKYTNQYLAILEKGAYTKREIQEFLLTLGEVIRRFVCTSIGWIDVMVPAIPSSREVGDLLIKDAISDRGWLKISFSSIRRTSRPTLIPIEINHKPWRGSGNAYTSSGIDYVSSFIKLYSGSDYNLPKIIARDIERQYEYWRQEHYFSALLAIAIATPDADNTDSIGVLNLKFTAENALGENDTLSPQRSVAILTVLEPALKLLGRAIIHNNQTSS